MIVKPLGTLSKLYYTKSKYFNTTIKIIGEASVMIDIEPTELKVTNLRTWKTFDTKIDDII